MGKFKSSNRIALLSIALVVIAMFTACSPATPIDKQGAIQKFNSNTLVNLHGISFHDYNGNGTKEYNEPVLPDIELEIINFETGQIFKIHTDENGAYSLSLPANKYKITAGKVIAGSNNQSFKYLYTSAKEINSLDKPLPVIMDQDKVYNLALTQGFLTLPYTISTNSYITIIFFDVDRRENYIRDWQGNQETYDQHSGTDYRIPAGTPVLAAAPGRIISSEFDRNSGNIITISHGVFITRYGHLSKRNVRAGDQVNRGQQIGLSGATGDWVGPLPHLHFELNMAILPGIDPYRDTGSPDSISYWTVDNSPRYP